MSYIIKLLLYLTESFFLGEEAEELPTRTILKHKEDLLLILESRVYPDQKRMVDLGEDVSFHHDPLDLVLLLDVFLLHGLDGVELAVVLLADEDDLGVGTLADD